MKALLGFFFGGMIALNASCAATPESQTVWTFDNLERIGGVVAHVEGHPKQIDTPAGKAAAFDGVGDALFVDAHPLAGAAAFTVEAIFRPDGGDFEQRWLHLAEVDPATGEDTGARFLFEIRVVEGAWYLDAFVTGPGYKQALVVPEKLFPIGRWYHVAQTFDGRIYRSYVDGVLQAEAPIAFRPQGPGHSSVGVRINKVNYFKGAMLNLRFTPRALAPAEFEKLPEFSGK
jgi:hypothetical protein